MVQFIPPPDYRSLLPPLLACLPTAFASPRPPPALLPLLSPILRQRVQLLAATVSSPTDSWLPLLCWEPTQAERLAAIVEGEAFELHPVSGEIDFGDVSEITYRRLDEETLHARVAVTDLDLVVIYLWCQADQESGGDSWRVSEVIPINDQQGSRSNNWCLSISEAEEKSRENSLADALRESSGLGLSIAEGSRGKEQEPVDDDDYWAQYDNTPARTPGPKQPSPANGTTNVDRRGLATSDVEYFARYGLVQPEMDNDDPSEDSRALGQSSLNGNVVVPSLGQTASNVDHTAMYHDQVLECFKNREEGVEINQPAASSPSTTSFTISRLEGSAVMQSHGEVAIRQHVSHTIKSLFRLSRGAGIDRADFDELVRTELDTLSLMDED
ncbi:hypothetical protein MMC07_003176 [Pseudocyphellaria aurata]|nr:hypothetical protein [Pseudocyphellaria aurata]